MAFGRVAYPFRIMFGRLACAFRAVGERLPTRVDMGAGMAYPPRNLRHRSVLWGSLFHQPVQTG
jgi:hypothetical protein